MLVLILSWGCSQQKSFAHRLEGADRVIVSTVPGQEGPTLAITGDEVTKVIRAVGSGKKESPLVMCTPDLQLQFFRGDKLLGRITTCVQVFWIDHKPYSDTTGVLEALSNRFRQMNRPEI